MLSISKEAYTSHNKVGGKVIGNMWHDLHGEMEGNAISENVHYIFKILSYIMMIFIV